ncbi:MULTISPECIES: branched-chain amino acid ABC transporter permease [Cupriavidus]|uniref:Amino acid/amide ABC transporter membrane protein 2, HAAT family n=1 Tax=Cupriavidus pinatubonensis (strain JMP 134 / LMG 1197) TaxID=264198 RepID=Q46MV3_CUPPJ|nr:MULTISPECIES: branched-chain amino acid ABC transporter permease [Cupriavidus]QYY33908.1 branched-chain amino acid ABC transporter permease [Cupriavidus pinatubonensis]TPQ37906.1 branched-chain amino acid ABC transporter permease [Cupriavidus pinatubonensis]
MKIFARSVGPCIAGALLLMLPLAISSPFYLDLAIHIMIAALIATSLNMLLGLGGLLSFAQSALAGAAAYGVAIAGQHTGFGPWMLTAMAVSVAVAFSVVVGILALRTSGLSIGMITLAIAQVLWGVAMHWGSVTGGENGIAGIARPALPWMDTDNHIVWFEFVAICFLLVLCLVNRFMQSQLGRCLDGTRSQPRRMSALGFDIWGIRLFAFAFAGLVAAIAGVLLAFHQQFISPHALSLGETAESLLMVIVGGPATLLGPVVGAVIVVGFRVLVSGYIESWPTFLGLLLIGVVLFVPAGVVPGFASIFGKRSIR